MKKILCVMFLLSLFGCDDVGWYAVYNNGAKFYLVHGPAYHTDKCASDTFRVTEYMKPTVDALEKDGHHLVYYTQNGKRVGLCGKF